MTQAVPAAETSSALVATYRVQLRCGVDLDRARALLPWLSTLGVSHLYLSPPFHAAAGSTHGYDVIDPTRIDPDLGGEPAFERLSDAAQQAGIGIVVDIVPNHMAFTPQNPFLADVLRNGRESRFAGVFDIDWDRITSGAARIHFPVLDGTPEQLLGDGQIALGGNPENPLLRVYERDFPLRVSDLARQLVTAERAFSPSALQSLLAEQHWSLGHWRDSADKIAHRRFFNITDLIGVRQEDPEVFTLTHRWIIDQVSAGRIQGLRVDHIDGLAHPGNYLHRLREAVMQAPGDVPIWIEKIVKPKERIPSNWPIEGMSGYEFMTPVTRLLTNATGLSAMRDAAAGAVPDDTSQEIRKVRAQLLGDVFDPELDRVTGAALDGLALEESDRPAVRQAIKELAIAWPVYRSYAADGCPLSLLVEEAISSAGQEPMAARVIDLLHGPDDAPARHFAARFEQLTGALTAKSEEDTVFFRSVAFLPLCEVGSEPDLEAIDAAAFEAAMMARAQQTPVALNALSTHDTKRSADARAVIVALSHFPELAGALYRHAREQAAALDLPQQWGLYALQCALMLVGQDDVESRMQAHIAKAMREGKDRSRHEDPDEAVEAAVSALAMALHAELTNGTLLSASEAALFVKAVDCVTMAQAALQLTAPGVPDIYQGTEVAAVALTDPDNRRAVAWKDLSNLTGITDTRDGRKLALTRELLARRRTSPDLFTRGSYRLNVMEGAFEVVRTLDDQEFRLTIPRPESPASQHPEGELAAARR